MPSGINWTIMYLCIHHCLSTAIPWISQLCEYCTMDTVLEFMGKHLVRIVAMHAWQSYSHKHNYVHNMVMNLSSYYVTKSLQRLFYPEMALVWPIRMGGSQMESFW